MLGRLVLVAAGAYVVGCAVWWWVADPLMRRDSTAERALGCPLALPKHRSAR